MALFIFSGNKGGVGKSMACVAFTEYLLSKGENPIVVETDTQNPDVGRKYNGHTHHINVVAGPKGWGEIADLADANRDRPIVLNLPAGIGTAWENGAPLLFDALAESGKEIPAYVFFVINRQKDSLVLLKNAMQMDPSGGAIKGWIVVKNLYFGEVEKFALWNQSKLRQEILASEMGHEMELPELMDWVADRLTGREHPVATDAESMEFTLSDRTSIKRWLRASGQECARLAHVWK